MATKTASSEGFNLLIQRLFRPSQSHISMAEHNRREAALNALKEALSMLEKEFGGDLVSVAAFGSFAKGREFDDIDVLIILKEIRNEQGARQRVAQTIGEVVFTPIYRKYHVLCNVLIYGKDELRAASEHPERRFPLWHDIAKHGIVLWGEAVVE